MLASILNYIALYLSFFKFTKISVKYYHSAIFTKVAAGRYSTKITFLGSTVLY